MSDVNLERIGWQNGTLISKAKVEINGVIYEVEPEEYSGSTPLSAENLTQMEDNIEDAINEGASKMERTILYNNPEGSSTDITLSENSEGYKRFIIEAINAEEQAICIVPEIIEPNGKKFPIITINTGGGGTKTFLGNSTWQVSGNQIIKTQANWLTTLNKNGATELSSHSNVRITKVIGYKY